VHVRYGRGLPIRVLIADDQPLVRSGLRAILGPEPDLEVIGEAADGAEAVAKVGRLEPDVVLMDVQMPGTDGLAATREIAAAGGPGVIVLTTFGHDEYLFEALRAGAAGFLLKDAPPDDIVEAVRLVHGGHGLLSPAVTRRVIAAYGAGADRTGPPPPGYEEMTSREREVFALIARGRTNGEIAAELVVSEATVKTHVGRVLLKLGLRDRVQLVIAAYEMGLVRPGDA
jgi:DNA-binding NarL/FixJ family response regulator